MPLSLPDVKKGCCNAVACKTFWDLLQSGANGELVPVEMVLSEAAAWWAEAVKKCGELKIISISEVL